jgi:hypothetical protein
MNRGPTGNWELLFRRLVLGAAGAGRLQSARELEATMNSIIYLVGLIVVVLLILSFFGLR